MDLGLKGKRAIVTGGTRGIGRAIADTLAAEGAHVAICARKANEVDDAVAALTAKGVKAYGAAMPHLEAAAGIGGDAAVVIISSVSAAETATANAYGALKASQIHFAKGLAKEKAKLHVRINVVSPGTVYFKGGVWHQVEQGMPELFKTTMARNPTGRMATPQEVANAAVFLASPVSAFTTGINLVVDGAITGRVNF